MDLARQQARTTPSDHPRFHFVEGDITINKEWIEYHIKKCDVVLPLVAIATPAIYVKAPLRVFELDFEENLRIVRQCVKYGKRVVFPSTSEVYGMCTDAEFKEDESVLITGPINKPRWIYSCAKQLMDRVIAAYGQQQGLQYTCFRPFNWIGPKLDSIDTAKEGSSRVVTQFMVDLFHGKPIKLVDGGAQKRCFTYVEDGIDGLMTIIENKGGVCDSPDLQHREPRQRVLGQRAGGDGRAPCFKERKAHDSGLQGAAASRASTRAPSTARATRTSSRASPASTKPRSILGWEPKTTMDEALSVTMDAFFEEWNAGQPAD